jgi:hypothetical protein
MFTETGRHPPRAANTSYTINAGQKSAWKNDPKYSQNESACCQKYTRAPKMPRPYIAPPPAAPALFELMISRFELTRPVYQPREGPESDAGRGGASQVARTSTIRHTRSRFCTVGGSAGQRFGWKASTTWNVSQSQAVFVVATLGKFADLRLASLSRFLL